MILARLRLLLLVWFAPILLGSICAAYEFALYRTLALNPETAPGFATLPVPIGLILGAALAACVFGSSVRKTARGMTNWPLASIAGVLCFGYVFWRAVGVSADLSVQLGYACCIADHPAWSYTILRIVDPLFQLW